MQNLTIQRKPLVNEDARQTFLRKRMAHWNRIALQKKTISIFSASYHRRIHQIYQNLIPPGARILELGCGQGDLLASLSPSVGVGVDFATEMLRQAHEKYPHLKFINADVQEINLPGEYFDFIILSDLINEAWDIQSLLLLLLDLCRSHTRVIINVYSRLWEIPLALAQKGHLANPVLNQNWLTVADIISLLELSGFEPIRSWQEILLPLEIPVLDPVFNRAMVRFWPFNQFALSNFIIARRRPNDRFTNTPPSLSIVIPARNEAGNISKIYDSIPDFNTNFELVFVEGGSSDNTFQVIDQNIKNHTEISSLLIKQTGIGKGNAVREGFEHASGDILMVLDADLTVPFEYLPRFYDAIIKGRGDFINGVRLVYPLEKESMRYLNILGNKFFSLLFSWILGQPIKDTLCGTKVLWKLDYQKIADNRIYFGDLDPFGDFDLLLGAARLNLKIIDIPIRYQQRSYGSTNIQRWKHGLYLIRMAIIAINKLKFQ